MIRLDRLSSRTFLVVVAVATLAAVVGAWVLIGDPGGVARGQAVDSCAVLDEPGRYVLAADVGPGDRPSCVRIAASDVTLDGDGHAVRGNGAFGSAGVRVEPDDGGRLSNVTVRNLTASGWDDAVRFVSVDGARIERVTGAESRVGISLLRVDDATVRDATARDNALRGVSVLEGGRNVTVANVTAAENDGYGVHLVESGVRNATVANATATRNEFGIALFGTSGVSLVGNDASDNRIAGVYLSGAVGGELRENRATDQFYGIFLADRSERNRVVANDLRSNEVGIRLRSSDRNVLLDNAVSGSGDTAVLVLSSDHVVVRGTTGSNNARGVSVRRSTNVSVADGDLSTRPPRSRVAFLPG